MTPAALVAYPQWHISDPLYPAIPSVLTWNTTAPLELILTFGEGREWVLSRSQLAKALMMPGKVIGIGDVTMMAHADGEFTLGLTGTGHDGAPDTPVTLRCCENTLYAFLQLTDAVLPVGAEIIWTSQAETELAQLLGGAS